MSPEKDFDPPDRVVTLDKPTTCLNCGVCCQFGLVGRVPFAKGEKVPDWHHETDSAVERCPWWKFGTSSDGQAGECVHYEDRPEICRTWEIGGIECMDSRKVYIQLKVNMPRIDSKPFLDP